MTAAVPDHQRARAGVAHRRRQEPEHDLRQHVAGAGVDLPAHAQPAPAALEVGRHEHRGIDALAVEEHALGRGDLARRVPHTARGPERREHVPGVKRPVGAERHEHRVPARRRDRCERRRERQRAESRARRQPRPRDAREQQAREPAHERQRHREPHHALDAQRRQQHEPTEERAGDGAERVERIGRAGGRTAAAGLQQPRGEREHRAQERAWHDQHRQHEPELRHEQPAPRRPGLLAEIQHRARQGDVAVHPPGGARGDAELQRGEPRHARASREERGDGRASEGDAREIDAEHRGERIDGGAEHEPVEPHPRQLERERREPARGEEHSKSEPRLRREQRWRRCRGDEHRRLRDTAGVARREHERRQRCQQVERRRHDGGAEEAQPWHEQEAREQGARDRAERVDGVEPREPGADRAAFTAGHEHRQRGAHECRRRHQQCEQQHQPCPGKCRALTAERAIELADRGVERAQERQQRHPGHGHRELELGVAPRGIAPAGESRAEQACAERQPAEKRSGHHGHRLERASQEVRELLAPHDLVDEPGGAGDEEAADRPGRRRHAIRARSRAGAWRARDGTLAAHAPRFMHRPR
jgi:hypothetical protein